MQRNHNIRIYKQIILFNRKQLQTS